MPKKAHCKNCGGEYTVEPVRHKGKRRLWCSYCGYWADRRKPKT